MYEDLTWFDMIVRHCSLLKGWSRKPKCKRDIAIMAGAGDLTKVLCLTSSCFQLCQLESYFTAKCSYSTLPATLFGEGVGSNKHQYVQIINSNFGPNNRNGWGLAPLCLVFRRFSNPLLFTFNRLRQKKHWIKQSWCSENIETTAYFG